MSLDFRVVGVAQQAGSKRAFVPKGWTRPIITDTNRSLKSWQLLVQAAASEALSKRPRAERHVLLDGVRLRATFFLPRPKSLPRRVVAHIKTPDVDKLARALCDALSGVVYRDDAQIVDLLVLKRYTRADEIPYVAIRIEPADGREV